MEAAEGGDGGKDLQEDGLLGGRYSGDTYSYGGLALQNRMGDDGNMYCHFMQSSDMDAFESMDEMLDEEEEEEEDEEEYWRQWRRWKRKKREKRRKKQQEHEAQEHEAKEEATLPL